MNELETPEKSKNKTVGRISRLFQKKPKKKSMASSVSSMSLSDPALSKQNTYQSSSSIASSQQSIAMSEGPKRTTSLEARSNHQSDTASIQSKLTRTLSMSSNNSMTIQQLINQQRNVLKELDAQKQMYQADVTKLSEQLAKTQVKIKQRTHDMDVLKSNYQVHLRSVRSSDDDANSIAVKLIELKNSIHVLACELLPHAEPHLTTEKLSTLWLNLGDSIDQLGRPLPPDRIQMLTEKFMMDVLVQNLNINIFPGLACNPEFLELSNWFDQYDTSPFYSTRLRQELSMLVVNNKSNPNSDIEQTWKKCVDRNWHHLYRGLQKAYPGYLLSSSAIKHSNSSSSSSSSSHCKETLVAVAAANEYGKKLRKLVEDTICLGSAIKGQEVCITAVDVREGVQQFDASLMEDEDGQTSGTIAFCISPPFVVKLSNRYEPLVKGRVLCFPSTTKSIVKTTSKTHL
ncbi:hypothetical protein EDC94DRAFT_692076 [Helicostylum pulchrum]|nr:hypothetical protein EDC94DRAFT_692076 [Helicostylum pulchrum]